MNKTTGNETTKKDAVPGQARMKVGIVGCGNISAIYLKNCGSVMANLEVAAVADIDVERARSRANEFGIARFGEPQMIYDDPTIDLVLNLTTPPVHATVNTLALQAGKHVYTEKPFAVSLADSAAVLALAKSKGLRVGCAPDTFLGSGIQLCRKLIDEGVIGEPIAATAFMVGHGHESWHPDPEFYYQVGGGPMLDMGPYYLTALVNLMGPIRSVSATTKMSFAERTITSEKKRGTKVKVEVPTHQAGVVDFVNGATATVIMSFDVWKAELPRIEIYGTKGTISVPDPNTFGGPVRLYLPAIGEWKEVPLYSHGFAENSRGLGPADMAGGIRNNRPHRASGELAHHVLEAMLAFDAASRAGARVNLQSSCQQPQPFVAADPQCYLK